ncbi:MAG TPA: hypothetical protein DEH24_20415 [Alteromonas sp.]|nr:hypothetical protein [Alteromonadaceae bacterium]MAX41449.1 hypothetical protein [Alteromonadaceae bacterium]HBY41805.1 hypothetical protein [Alteromonas sp.]|tara:strand:- start:53 stop:307 length:255 start_codon:yes stop_codon:yes gene_type:complete
MAHRRTATKMEKQIIERLVHAFIISEIGNEVIAKDFQEHAQSYREYMRKEFPHWFRLLDEFQAVVPRVRKQLLAEFEKDKKKNP